MEISKKTFSLAIILCFVIAFASGYAIQNNFFISKPAGHLVGNLYITIDEPMGIQAHLNPHNLVTNIGDNQTGIRISTNGTYVQVRWISLGNATPAYTLTKLTTEATTFGATRKLCTFVAYLTSGSAPTGGNYAFNITAKFYFTGDITLDCAGAQWSAISGSDNNLYACATISPTAVMHNLWNMTILWNFIYVRS
jgi:hypothetical protein